MVSMRDFDIVEAFHEPSELFTQTFASGEAKGRAARFRISTPDSAIVETFHEPPKDLGKIRLELGKRTIFGFPKSLGAFAILRFKVPMHAQRRKEAPHDSGLPSKPRS